MPIAKHGLKGSIPSLLCGIETNCCTFGGSMSKSCICSFADYWAWDSSSFLGHLWCSCPFDLCSYLEDICGPESNLGNMDFAFCL
jgi:hypothetical protein